MTIVLYQSRHMGGGMAEFTKTTTYAVHCPHYGGDRIVKVGIRNGPQGSDSLWSRACLRPDSPYTKGDRNLRPPPPKTGDRRPRWTGAAEICCRVAHEGSAQHLGGRASQFQAHPPAGEPPLSRARPM